jgi:hypothetical protein
MDKENKKAETKSKQIEHNKNNLLLALEKTFNNVQDACKLVGLSRGTYYLYYNKDKEFALACDELKNVNLDFAESKLFQEIKKGNITAIIFYLKCQGKKRGYIDRADNEMTGNVINVITPQQKK